MDHRPMWHVACGMCSLPPAVDEFPTHEFKRGGDSKAGDKDEADGDGAGGGSPAAGWRGICCILKPSKLRE